MILDRQYPPGAGSHKDNLIFNAMEEKITNPQERSLKKVMYILIAVAVVLALVLAYVWYQKSSLVSELNIEKEALTEQMISLQNDYASLSSDNDRINAQLDSSREEVSQLLRGAVEAAAAHAGTQVARRFARRGGGLEEPVFHHGDRQAQQRGVLLDLRAVFRAVARVHHEIDEFEGPIREPLQQLHALRQQHGVLPAGNAHRHAVAFLQHVVFLQPAHKRRPDFLAKLFLDAQLRFSPPFLPSLFPCLFPRGCGAFLFILSIFAPFVHPAAADK